MYYQALLSAAFQSIAGEDVPYILALSPPVEAAPNGIADALLRIVQSWRM